MARTWRHGPRPEPSKPDISKTARLPHNAPCPLATPSATRWPAPDRSDAEPFDWYRAHPPRSVRRRRSSRRIHPGVIVHPGRRASSRFSPAGVRPTRRRHCRPPRSARHRAARDASDPALAATPEHPIIQRPRLLLPVARLANPATMTAPAAPANTHAKSPRQCPTAPVRNTDRRISPVPDPARSCRPPSSNKLLLWTARDIHKPVPVHRYPPATRRRTTSTDCPAAHPATLATVRA